jgi:hypothetical protein
MLAALFVGNLEKNFFRMGGDAVKLQQFAAAPRPHPALRATFPGWEGFGCVRIRRTVGGLTGN